MDQIALQLAIAFFGIQVAAWAGLGLYIRYAAQQRRAQAAIAPAVDSLPEMVAQAA